MDLEVGIFDSDSGSELEDWVEVVFRKPYVVRERLNHMNMWNDQEFKIRFRLSKETVNNLLEMVQEYLQFPTERYRPVCL